MGATAAGKKIRTDESLLLYTVLQGHPLSHLSPSFWLKNSNLLGIQNTALPYHPSESPREGMLAAKAILWGLWPQQETRNSVPHSQRKPNPNIIATRIPFIFPTTEKSFLKFCHF